MHFTAATVLSLAALASARALVPRQQGNTAIILADCEFETVDGESGQLATFNNSNGGLYNDFKGQNTKPNAQGYIPDPRTERIIGLRDTRKNWNDGKGFTIKLNDDKRQLVGTFNAQLQKGADTGRKEGESVGSGNLKLASGAQVAMDCVKVANPAVTFSDFNKCTAQFKCSKRA